MCDCKIAFRSQLNLNSKSYLIAFIGRSIYYLCLFDLISRKFNVLYIEKINWVIESFKKFIKKVENNTDKRVEAIRSEIGGEFFNKQLRKYVKIKEWSIKRRQNVLMKRMA